MSAVYSFGCSWIVLSKMLGCSLSNSSLTISSCFNTHGRSSSPAHLIFLRSCSNWVRTCFLSGMLCVTFLRDTWIAPCLGAISPTRLTDMEKGKIIGNLDTETMVHLEGRGEAPILPLLHSSSTRKRIAQVWQGKRRSCHLFLATGSYPDRCVVPEPSPRSRSVLGSFPYFRYLNSG